MRRWVVVKTKDGAQYSGWTQQDVFRDDHGVTVVYESGWSVFIPYDSLCYVDNVPEDHPEAGKKPIF